MAVVRRCWHCQKPAPIWLRAHYDGAIWIMFCCFQHSVYTTHALAELRFGGKRADFVSEHYVAAGINVPLPMAVDSP